MDEKLWTLLGKKLSGEATREQLEDLQRMQLSNADIAFYVEKISKWWQLAELIGGRIQRQHLKNIYKGWKN